MSSDVYLLSSRAPVRDGEHWANRSYSLVSRLERLASAAGLEEFIDRGDLVAVKVHFGDHGTTRTVRSVYIRKVVQLVKRAGGEPFVTETTGLGMRYDRSSAPGRIKIARENGYTFETLDAPIVIADGLLGFDGVPRKLSDAALDEVLVAKAILEADKVVALTHFTGHFSSSFGGAIKNIGVGCVAKPTKYDLHIDAPPAIDAERCTLCNACAEHCPGGAISPPRIEAERCIRCNGCEEYCEHDAILLRWTDNATLSKRIAAAAKAVLEAKGRENFLFFNFLVEVTPHCDCCAFSDNPIVPDIGVLASRDALAIDRASLDLIEGSQGLENTLLSEESRARGARKFESLFEDLDTRVQLLEAQRLALGSAEYRLIEVD
ncbi:MAG: DUF362 domain-containing protein [Euryarchaeota archaeon]|nr:DUF362 domain-containing protein [Euryarchaeota archaeon]